MMKLTAYYYREQKMLLLQKADYVEDGGYIEIKGNVHNVFEIPTGGGNPELIKSCTSLDEAMSVMELLK
ncbi:unnamed protein product [marine sediment metagenome]|uniref:Phage protein n=1 Tax=marine sediment metagenome TaxID=412755 RepID=X1C7H7_9ZZZZ